MMGGRDSVSAAISAWPSSVGSISASVAARASRSRAAAKYRAWDEPGRRKVLIGLREQQFSQPLASREEEIKGKHAKPPMPAPALDAQVWYRPNVSGAQQFQSNLRLARGRPGSPITIRWRRRLMFPPAP